MTDSVTSGYFNQYSAKTATGHSSSKYAVAYLFNPVTFENTTMLKLAGGAMGHPVKGFYVTNSTYAYNSMRDGDGITRKFHNGDWFKLLVRGYYHGALKPDSLGFYLANYLQPDSSDNYIVNTWEWFNLEPLGKVDSLVFKLTSTVGNSGGMLTPAYFCMDDFTTYETADTTTPTTHVNTQTAAPIRMYPNPAHNMLYVDVADKSAKRIAIMNVAGAMVTNVANPGQHNEINTASLPAGTYLLQVVGDGKMATMRFVKD